MSSKLQMRNSLLVPAWEPIGHFIEGKVRLNCVGFVSAKHDVAFDVPTVADDTIYRQCISSEALRRPPIKRLIRIKALAALGMELLHQVFWAYCEWVVLLLGLQPETAPSGA